MKVLYHSDAFASNTRYGLSRVAWELYESILAVQADIKLVPFSSRCKLGPEQLDTLIREHGFIKPSWKHRNLVLSWALFGYPDIGRWSPDADIVHTVEMDYPVTSKKPWVVTVHDLGPLTHPEYFSKSRPWLRMAGIKAAIKRADVIAAVSSSTAEAIESIAKMNLGDRLRVIPEGVSPYFFENSSADSLSGLSDMPEEDVPFYLWTGSLNPRKNLGHVLDAFEKIADDVRHELVLAGGLGWDSHNLLDRIERSKFSSRIHRPGFVSDEQLRGLYTKASGFIYASYMEGFGLPILEAMACSCPVVTSNVSSMPEVAGNASILVDPHSVDEIVNAMLEIANNDELAKRLAVEGEKRAKQFTWDKCAHSMIDVYESII